MCKLKLVEFMWLLVTGKRGVVFAMGFVDPQISEVMKYLQDYYVEGITITCAVVVLIYLTFSIRLLFTSKDVGMKVLASAFIPGVNIIIWVIKCFKSALKSRRERLALGEDDEIKL